MRAPLMMHARPMRQRARTWLAAGAAAFVLAACGSAPTRSPAPLPEIKTTLPTRIVWSASVGKSGVFNLAPAVVDDAVYAAAADGSVARFDLATGRRAWETDSVVETISAGVAADGERVVVGGPDGDVAALSAADGKPLWNVKLPGEMYGAPVLANGIAVFRSSDARLFAVDAATGQRLWTLQRPLPALVLRADAGMVAAGDLLLASFPGGRLIGLALKTGTVRFDVAIALPKGTTELERIADVIGTPALDGADACVAAYQGRIGCVNAATGAQVWGRDFSSAVGVAADPRYVFGVDERSVLQAFVRASGVTMWTNDKLKDRNLSTPASWGRAVAVGDLQGYVHLLSREEGVFLARVSTDGSAIRVAPRVVERGSLSLVLVQTSGGGLYAIAGE